MTQWTKRDLTGYVIAVLSVALIAVIRLLLMKMGVAQHIPFLLFVAPVVAASWYNGFGAGVVATLLSLFVIDYFFMPPFLAFSLRDLSEVISYLLFIVQGILISLIGEKRLNVMQALTESRDQLELRVAARTRELAEVNRALEEEAEQRRAAYDELARTNASLQISNRELQDFASVASHDLQEPLRKILSFGDRLKRASAATLEQTGGADYLERILRAADRMQTLINDLLTFSRVTSRAQPFTQVNLNQILGEVLGDLETRIEDKHGQIHAGDLPIIRADPLQMRQVFQNLLSNALKFVPPERDPVIQITGRPIPRPEGNLAGHPHWFELLIKDNGIGFEERYLDRIFNVFQRLHAKQVYEGTGIGLAIVRKIVERHGGQITARSTPGEGSTFIIQMPFDPTPEQDVP